MPSDKRRRDMGDTWKPDELADSIGKSAKDLTKEKEKKKKDHKSKDKDKEREKKNKGDEEREERHRRHKEKRNRDRDDEDREERHRRHKDKRDRDRDLEDDERRQRRHKSSRDRERDEEDDDRRQRRHKDDRRDRDPDRDERNGDKHKKHRDEDGDKKHKKHKDKDREEEDKERHHKKHKEKDREEEDKERHHKKHKEKDKDAEEDKERHHKKHKEKDREEEDKEKHHKKHKEKDKEEEEKPPAKKHGETEEERKFRKDEEKRIKKEKERKERKEKEAAEKAAAEAAAKKKEKEPEEDDYNYDDDDFEDYDDDFEDDDEEAVPANKSKDSSDDSDASSDNSGANVKHSTGYYKSFNWDPDNASQEEVSEVMRAMNEENKRLQKQMQNKDQLTPEPKRDSSKQQKSHNFINFTVAKQRQVSRKAGNKIRRRGEELQQLIELDKTHFWILDMQPMNEYEMYMRSFGRSDAQQASTMTGDENVEFSAQTEPIEKLTKWSQHPPEDFLNVCGGDGSEEKFQEEPKIDSLRLASFLVRAGKVINSLIVEEEVQEFRDCMDSNKGGSIMISDAFRELKPVPMLSGRHVIDSDFSPVETHYLLTAYSRSTKPHPMGHAGIIAVWNINTPNLPEMMLFCEGEPRSCCFSPYKVTLAFAGMADGSVCCWDLRESHHLRSFVEDNLSWPLRYPSYNTAGVLTNENHKSPVIQIKCVVTKSETSHALDESLNFQVATMEENATVNFWVVAEVMQVDPAGSESDLGLAPGSKVKLVKSSQVHLSAAPECRNNGSGDHVAALCMALSPDSNSHFYVATELGEVHHRVRYGGRAPPRLYIPEIAHPAVTAIDFSPFHQPVFLAGCNDGSVHLYHCEQERPLISWQHPPIEGGDQAMGQGVRYVRWCSSRPAVFFVVDESSRLHIWDLNMSDTQPMKTDKLANINKVTSFDLSSDLQVHGHGLTGRAPMMLICLENGLIEVHMISKKFSALMDKELHDFKKFLLHHA